MKSVVYQLEFIDNGMVATGTLAVAPAEGGAVRVTSAMDGDLGLNPMGRWMGLFMDKLIGPDFEAGLVKMKRVAETGK